MSSVIELTPELETRLREIELRLAYLEDLFAPVTTPHCPPKDYVDDEPF